MKRLLVLFGFLCFSLSNAQTEEVEVLSNNGGRRHDVMGNPIALVLGVGNFSYEYSLNEDSGLGVSTFFVFDDYSVKTDAWYIMPYYRYYFGKGWAKGFFLEGFTGILGDSEGGVDFSKDYFRRMEGETNFGFGIGLGGKWFLKKNLLFEASVGVGRRVDNEYSPVFGKGMLGLGYRF